MGGGFERLHYLLDDAFDSDGHLSAGFLKVLCLTRMILLACSSISSNCLPVNQGFVSFAAMRYGCSDR